uniref:Nuclear protein MDM1 n=1 Tax=Astyanax mexicanus TaxID=7994 RepID=A0A8B9HIU0_ASTMX
SPGITEYQNKYKARARRVKSAPPQRRMRLAGVRSDQLGISREPQFQSKRRVPFYPPQVSSSLQWRDSAGSLRQQEIARPGSPPASVHVTRTSSPEKVETPLAPRTSKPQRAKKTSQHVESVSCSQVRSPSADQQEQEHPSNGVSAFQLHNSYIWKQFSPMIYEGQEREKKREQRLSRKPRSREDSHPEPQPVQQEVISSQKDSSPKVLRKVKTEYTSNFRSPLQYRYKDGAWIRSRVSGEEVQDLRAKADAYRKRAWGTHFSRQHLSQVISEQNCLWEASSASSSSTLTEQDSHSHSSPTIEALDLARVDSVRGSCSPGASVSLSTSRRSSFEGVGLSDGPTLPLQRKQAWDEEERPYVNGVSEIKPLREEPPVQQAEESDEEEDTNEVPVNEHLSPAAGTRCSVEEGRLPTPKLKTIRTVQRTHHDRTTPTIVSYIFFSQAENGSLPRSSPAAGLATIDPLPLRDDTWARDSPEPKPVRTPQRRTLSATLIATSSPRANRIQGTLRNPEFQHNGNLGLHRPDQFVFLSSDSGVSDNDDRMSQISSRSAASCSMASEVLDRAQRRKEDFWGKT